MSDTPRTDAAAIGFARLLVEHKPEFKVTELVPSDFARTLERQNAELLAALREIAGWTMHSGSAYQRADGYSDMYYLIEGEVNKARDIAREAIRRAEG